MKLFVFAASRRILTLILLLLISFPAASDTDLEYLSAFTEKGMEMWHVPGMSVAVVTPDDVLFQKGFGETSIDDGTAVDEHTLKCLEHLDRIWEAKEPPYVRYTDMFQSLERPFVLYLAVLLHDAGKGTREGDHSVVGARLAVEVAQRLDLSLIHI